jgi:N-acetylmuramoyl-L-alanine amidase
MTKLIALDAGHGVNTYPPSKGHAGFAEFTFNSAAVKHAKAELERQGFRVLLTQPLNGTDTPLSTRTKNANKARADLLLSFHADANSNKDARGHWAFYWHTSSAGKRFADMWSAELSKTTGTKHRGNHPSKHGSWTNFHIVRETNMVAVLMEHAFMTNVQDMALLKSAQFQKQCGEAAARAVCRYFGVTYKEEKPASKPQSQPKKEEPFMNEKAVVINSFADYPVAESLANRLGAPIYTRAVASKSQVAKELFVVGGDADGLRGKVTLLSGQNRFETAAKVAQYLK